MSPYVVSCKPVRAWECNTDTCFLKVLAYSFAHVMLKSLFMKLGWQTLIGLPERTY